MSLILENLGKLFEPRCKNLDGKFWVQKVILKKYLKKKLIFWRDINKGALNNIYTLIEKH